MPPVEEVTILLQTDLLQDLSPAELEPLLPAVHRRRLERGAYFYRVGEEAKEAWVLVQGQAKMVMPTPAGDEIVLDVMVPGQLFGLPAIFATQSNRIGDSIATEACVALAIDGRSLVEFLARHPAATRRALARLADLVREYAEAILYIAHEDLRGRLARRLLDLAEIIGEEGGPGRRIPARISQETLAGMVGATRSKVNRALAALVASGHVSVQEGLIVVSDPERLRHDYPDWLAAGRPSVSRGA